MSILGMEVQAVILDVSDKSITSSVKMFLLSSFKPLCSLNKCFMVTVMESWFLMDFIVPLKTVFKLNIQKQNLLHFVYLLAALKITTILMRQVIADSYTLLHTVKA